MILAPVACLAVAALALTVSFVVRRLRSRLRSVPGPAVSLFTSGVLKWKEITAARTLYIHDLHEKFGPVVRIAPNEVSFTSWTALKEIYCSGGSGYDKTCFYDLFKVFGRRTMFTTLNKADHAKRKRLLADRYANTNIMRAASLEGIQERARAFVLRCTKAGTRPVDVYIPLHAYACDCVTNHLFHPYGSDCIANVSDEEMMHQAATDDSLQNRLLSYYNPTLHCLFSGLLRWFAKPRAVPLVDDYVRETSKRSEVASFTLLCRLAGQAGLQDQTDVAAECLDHMVAGIDTTGDALCFLMWELSQPRSVHHQRRLTEELQENPELPIDQLPFLDAIVNEGLRCYPVIPMSLPRLTPQGGRIIDGHHMPEMTVVSCQAYSVHRLNTHVFADAQHFQPERWLSAEGDADRRRHLFSFSSGGRGCVGKHLAIVEMKTLLRHVYSRYSTTPDPSMTNELMAMSDQLISTRPMGQKCLLMFQDLPRAEAW